MSARELLCRRHAKGAGTCCDGEVDGDARHKEVVREAKVKPLPILRMIVSTRPVVRGRGHEPQPQSPSSRLHVVHTQPVRSALGSSCEHREQNLHPACIMTAIQVSNLSTCGP